MAGVRAFRARPVFLDLLLRPRGVLRWLLLTRPIRFTRFGTFYVLFALAVGAAAINTGNNLLYLILGLLLGLIVVSGFLSDSCLWGLRTEWHASPAYVGELAVLRVRLSKGWFPAIATWITAYWSDGQQSTFLAPWVSARGP